MNKLKIIFLSIIVIVLLGGIGYLLFAKKQPSGETLQSPSPILSPQPTSSPQLSPTLIPSPSPHLTLANVKENIEAAVNSKNFAALTSYATRPTIDFIIMSSECCGPITPEEAVDQLKYVNSGLPLDFNQDTQLIKNLKRKNPQLTDTFIGISKTQEQLAAFTIDSQNRISQVQVSVSWKLY